MDSESSWDDRSLEPTNNERAVHNSLLEDTSNDKIWTEKYRKLKAFKEAYGHCDVFKSSDNKPLLSWIAMQRSLHRTGNLRNDREALLNELEFIWSTPAELVKEAAEARWMDKYNRLVAFKQRTGHCKVSYLEDKELYTWINNQRVSQRTGTLRPDREQLLNKLGLVWNPNKTNAQERRGTSRKKESETLEVVQKFPLGTKIQKHFEVDGGATKLFRGKIAAFEKYEEQDGSLVWGYMVHYKDGDKEHMLESDVAKLVAEVKGKKRAKQNGENSKSSKRLKDEGASTAETNLIATDENDKAVCSAISEKGVSIARASTKDRKNSSPKKTGLHPGSRTSRRLQNGVLESSACEKAGIDNNIPQTKATRKVTTDPTDLHSQAENMTVRDEATHKEQASLPNQEMGSEESLKAVMCKDTEYERVDGAASTIVTKSPHQGFPHGTLISRTFFDMNDSKREKAYGGKVVDYLYLDEERDWFYFIRYDDGDTEFMDEWEVAKFASSIGR